MLDNDLTLTLADNSNFRLRTITKKDLGNLRIWKNKHKNSFFLKVDISPEQQESWYINFRERDHDYMFVVEQNIESYWEAVGCMGFRKLADEDCVDAYNIIRGRKLEPSSFSMSDAFRTMLKYAASLYSELPIRCKVLCDNQAVEWYKKNEFSIIDTINGEYYLMELSKDSLKNYNLIINTK